MTKLDLPEVDTESWMREALEGAVIVAIADRNYELFKSFAESLGELAIRQDLGIDLSGED